MLESLKIVFKKYFRPSSDLIHSLNRRLFVFGYFSGSAGENQLVVFITAAFRSMEESYGSSYIILTTSPAETQLNLLV